MQSVPLLLARCLGGDPLRRQLAAYSPLSGGALWRAWQATTLGSDTRGELERCLAKEYDAATVRLVDRGTNALQLALRIAGARVAREPVVALPAYTCFEVASAAGGAGVGVALYDLDPETLSPDLVSLERVLRTGVQCAVVTPLFGIPIDWTSVRGLADRYGAIVIEDSAQGHGASWGGKPLGSLGALSVLSFGRGKGWTGGGGGALLARGPLAEVAAAEASGLARPTTDWRPPVFATAQWLLGRPSLYGLPAALPFLQLGETVYHEPTMPRPIALFCSALALETRASAEREAVVRRTRGARWKDTLHGRSTQHVSVPTGGEAGYLRYPLRIVGGGQAFAARYRALGVAVAYPTTLGELSAVRARLLGPETSWPGAEALSRELVTLPTHSLLSDQDVERLTMAGDGRDASDGSRRHLAVAYLSDVTSA
jgi:perosamine synthetase